MHQKNLENAVGPSVHQQSSARLWHQRTVAWRSVSAPLQFQYQGGPLLELNLGHELIRMVSGRRSKIEHDNENEHDDDFGPSGPTDTDTGTDTSSPRAALAEEGSLSDVLRFD